uniref:Uncharacterized protein n=1 Tax=Meloidogyne enterolobii TaxID=390850 RepID=A0A6V7XAP5_MELEN|nr:unnamed protein product [Meloidogyne enterolobii]
MDFDGNEEKNEESRCVLFRNNLKFSDTEGIFIHQRYCSDIKISSDFRQVWAFCWGLEGEL